MLAWWGQTALGENSNRLWTTRPRRHAMAVRVPSNGVPSCDSSNTTGGIATEEL